MKLRDYQEKIVDAVVDEFKEHNSTLVVCPTGGGKTICFAHAIKRIAPTGAIVLAHREELIFQAAEKIRRATGLDCAIEMADLTADTNLFTRTPVIVSTVQSQIAGSNGFKRMHRFKPNDFGLLIVDECHHATADSYRKVIEYYRQNPNLKVLGVTATPDRADEEALGQIFESVAYDYEILDAINDGWLVPVMQQMVKVTGLDFSHIRITAGDLNGADLARVMEDEKNLQGMVGSAIEIIGDKRTIFFTSSVRHAEMSCNILNRHRQGMAAWISAGTPKDQRRQTLKSFESGEIQVVCNCGVLLEGFDNPAVEVIVMGRPTTSRALYAQCCGRSLRPLPGIVDGVPTADERKQAIAASKKPSALIVDYVGASGRHKLMTTADILGGKVSDPAIEKAIEKAKSSARPILMSDALREAEEEIRKAIERSRIEEEARKQRLIAKVDYKSKFIDPFAVWEIHPVKERGWDRGKTYSEKQANFLRRMGMNPDDVPYGEGQQLIAEQIKRWKSNLCTLKQSAWLKKHGYRTNLTIQQASQVMDAWAKNKWQRPKQEINFN